MKSKEIRDQLDDSFGNEKVIRDVETVAVLRERPSAVHSFKRTGILLSPIC